MARGLASSKAFARSRKTTAEDVVLIELRSVDMLWAVLLPLVNPCRCS